MSEESSKVFEILYQWKVNRILPLNESLSSGDLTLKNCDKIFFSMSLIKAAVDLHRIIINKHGIFNPETITITIQHERYSRIKKQVIYNWENDDVVQIQFQCRYPPNFYCKILFDDVNFDLHDRRILSKASSHSMEKYLLSTEYSDVTINVEGNKEELSAHKVVLASHSCVFERMFNTDMKEAKENRICFGEFDIDTVKEVLQFMYTGKIKREDDVDLLFRVLACAKMYQIEKLKIYCEYKLIQNLNVDNIITISVNIDNLDTPKLKEKVKLFFEFNSNRISAIDTLKEVNHSKILFDFLVKKVGMKIDKSY